jgi:hypothetical protein
MTATLAVRAFRRLRDDVREAATQARLAYEFSANSYSFASLNACIAAQQAVEVLRSALAAAGEGRDDGWG